MLLVALGCTHTAYDDPSTCAGCHAKQSTAWQASRHAVAADNPIYNQAVSRALDPWCSTCHQAGGVRCVSCHGAKGGCERCHQFDLPGTELASQDTAREHQRSSFADQPCTSCHDPHNPPGAHDHSAVRRAVTVRVQATGTGSVATITSHGVGHALPTGDPFRRLELQLCADRACTEIVASHTLERRLRTHQGTWEQASDTRIPPPTDGPDSSITLILPPSRAWQLYNHLADPRHPPVEGSSWLVQQGWVDPLSE